MTIKEKLAAIKNTQDKNEAVDRAFALGQKSVANVKDALIQSLIDDAKTAIVERAMLVNHYKRNEQIDLNHANYGRIGELMNLLNRLGETVTITSGYEGDYAVIVNLTVNGKTTVFIQE